MKKILSLFVLTACFSIAALADVRLPDTPKPTPSPKAKKSMESDLMIRVDKTATEARLLVPKNQFRQLRAELEGADDDSTGAAVLSISRTQTIVSGLFLTLAFVFGGVWFARRDKTLRPNKALVAGVVIFLCSAFASVVYANIGPPIESRSITSRLFDRKVFTPFNFAQGKIKVEMHDGDGFMLVVPDKWNEEAK